MANFYLGYAKDGRIVARSSTRPDFKFAGLGAPTRNRIPSFAPSAAGALKNAETSGWNAPLEAVPVELVDAATYKAAIAKRGPARL